MKAGIKQKGELCGPEMDDLCKLKNKIYIYT